MKRSAIFLTIFPLGFMGCVTAERTPTALEHLRLEPRHSPLVSVSKLWLEQKDGPVTLRGYVLRGFDTKDTTQTHLDVTIYDAAGETLRRTVEHFEPRQIPRRPRMPDSARFRVVLDPLPATTSRIEVRAHEGSHEIQELRGEAASQPKP